jgi:hypothetical protein
MALMSNWSTDPSQTESVREPGARIDPLAKHLVHALISVGLKTYACPHYDDESLSDRFGTGDLIDLTSVWEHRCIEL